MGSSGYGRHLRLKANFKKYRRDPQPGNEAGHRSVERNIFLGFLQEGHGKATFDRRVEGGGGSSPGPGYHLTFS